MKQETQKQFFQRDWASGKFCNLCGRTSTRRCGNLVNGEVEHFEGRCGLHDNGFDVVEKI